jgi:hypothetical protein
MTQNQEYLRETLTVQEDPDTGDLFVLFPQIFLDSVGWKEGDTLKWEDQGNGSWTLSKKNV